MIGIILLLVTLVTLTQAKAIVTNHCPYNIYVWSVPQVLSSSNTANVPLKPGGQYQEPWRHGSPTNPGIAIKVSPQADGILKLADELNFAYLIQPSNKARVQVDLSPVRGTPFNGNLTFHTCAGHHASGDVQPHTCNATDDIELVLCGAERTTPAQDAKPLEQIQACYDYAEFDDDSSSSSDDTDDDDDFHEKHAANPSTLHFGDEPLILSPCLAKVVYPAKRAARGPPGPTFAHRATCPSCARASTCGLTLNARSLPPLCLADWCEPALPDVDCTNLYTAASFVFSVLNEDINDYVGDLDNLECAARSGGSCPVDQLCEAFCG